MSEAEPLTDERIRAELERCAAEGYDTDGEIRDRVLDVLADEYGEQAQPDRIGRLAEEVFRARAELERSWPVPTDNDRLDRAFEALEARGIAARQNFACCQNCGHAEIGGEADEDARGYTFFHAQDTESAAETGQLYLAYGAFLPEETPKEEYQRASREIGHEIVAALRSEGLAPSWSGDVGQRIVVPLTWRRRRPRG